MNFNQIKTNYPKAFEALELWYLSREKCDLELIEGGYIGSFYNDSDTWRLFNDRDLYDFFDEKGVLVHIFPFRHAQDGSHCFQAFLDDGSDRTIFHTRTETEHLAFEKAFEILENQLLDA